MDDWIGFYDGLLKDLTDLAYEFKRINLDLDLILRKKRISEQPNGFVRSTESAVPPKEVRNGSDESFR